MNLHKQARFIFHLIGPRVTRIEKKKNIRGKFRVFNIRAYQTIFEATNRSLLYLFNFVSKFAHGYRFIRNFY